MGAGGPPRGPTGHPRDPGGPPGAPQGVPRAPKRSQGPPLEAPRVPQGAPRGSRDPTDPPSNVAEGGPKIPKCDQKRPKAEKEPKGRKRWDCCPFYTNHDIKEVPGVNVNKYIYKVPLGGIKKGRKGI